MEKISSGGGVVATSVRGALPADDNLRWCRHAWCFSDERDLAGPTPSPKTVFCILAAAAKCSTDGHSEAGWNVLIDFCIYIGPAFDQSSVASTLQSVITNRRGNLPGAVLNHKDYRPLRERLIALSIETKKTGEGWDGATLQLGVWQSAHWSFLRQLVEGQRRKKIAKEAARRLALAEEGARSVQQARQGAVEGPDGDADSTETNSQGQVEPQEPEIAVRPYPLPDFIPGIIVQGHDWDLVITTTDGQQTQLWQKVTIGTTNTSKGIYQIVYALQILRQWAQDVYWPWLRALIIAF
ncbi:hypothetical protein EDB80DRAFT_870376 [Ilyonectria destructans]|nr:hypothetical protein EDB80DRAFT_870376 [Ilyonectria destructans]